ncbi:MAG: hypothetical protein ACLQMH_07845 [Solirubrobacteraceae bacterium]
MSRTSESRAETAKLARLLGVEDPQALEFLLPVPARELRDYREAVTDLLYDDDQELLARTADAARLLPAGTLAAIGERALGPLICARLTSLLDPRRAAEIAEHFTLDFVAQLAAELDPRRAVEVVSAIAADTVAAISAAMAANGEHIAMGRFVAYLDETALSRCIETLGDEDLLRVVFVMEGEERLVSVFEMIGAARTERMLAAARVNGLLEEAEHVLGRLDAVSASTGARPCGRERPSGVAPTEDASRP